MSAPANAAAPPIKLKIRTAAGDFLITDGLTKHSSWAQLQRKIESTCGVSVPEQQLSASYPPPAHVISAAPHATLAELKIMSNDLLILKQVAPAAPPAAAAAASPSPAPLAAASSGSAPVRAPSTPNAPPPASLDSLSHLIPLWVQPIPNDNSCLFNSVNFLIEGVMSPDAVTELRQTVASIILADADDKYNEAFLGDMTKEVYTRSILQPNTWGGGIELAILADFFDCEIAALDTETCHQYVFGQSDAAVGSQQKSKRIYLVFYGVHYDALIDTERNPPQRVFHPADAAIAARALLTARRLQAAGSFTNVSKFTLRCSQCKAGLVGAVEAQEHAKATGHTNFEEYNKE